MIKNILFELESRLKTNIPSKKKKKEKEFQHSNIPTWRRKWQPTPVLLPG